MGNHFAPTMYLKKKKTKQVLVRMKSEHSNMAGGNVERCRCCREWFVVVEENK